MIIRDLWQCSTGKVLASSVICGIFDVSRFELLTKTATYQQFCEKLGESFVIEK